MKKRFKLFSQKVATWPWQGTPPLAWRWRKSFLKMKRKGPYRPSNR